MQLPLLGGLGRPRSPVGREGAPIGEVSNRSQQTALLPRPGSWNPQAQPQSERARALSRGWGEWGRRAWPSSLPAFRGALFAAQGAPGGPEGERATEHALLQQRVEGTLPESRCVPLLSSRGAGAGLRHRLGLHRGQRLYRAPSGGSTCREASPDPQGKSSLGRCLRRYC